MSRNRVSRSRVSRSRAGAALLLVSVVAAGLTVPASAAPQSVVNGKLEQVSRGTPTCFTRAGTGRARVAWAITKAARSGRVAQSITVSRHSRGSWLLLTRQSSQCAPAVTPGATYRLSVAYRSTSRVNRMKVYRHSRAGWTFWTDLSRFGATSRWRTASAVTPVVPAGTDRIAFGLAIGANGTLVTDDYAIARASRPVPPRAAGELTTNGTLEAGGTTPTGWRLEQFGNGRVTGKVVATAHTGRRAYSATVTGRTTGDVKLLPVDATAPAVQPGKTYTLSAWYRSTSSKNAITVFAHTAAGWAYWTDLTTGPRTSTWRRIAADTPVIPAGVDAIAWGVSMVGNGTLVTDDYSTLPSQAGPPVISGDPGKDGRWTVLDYQMPIRSMHATVLKNGKVLLIAGSGNDVERFGAGTFQASVWDPVTGTFQTIDVPADMFCSGHVTLPDGRVLIQGGTKSYPTVAGKADYGGLKDTFVFNPDDNSFTKVGDAEDGHWYPTLTQLGNGDVWMAGGLGENTEGSVTTEYWDSTTQQWLPEAQVKQTFSFWGLYPHMFLLQDGRLFYSGGHVFGNGLPGTGASLYNIGTGAIVDVPGLREKDMRDQSASVLLPPAQAQRVLITGGGNIDSGKPGINLTDIIDLKAARPTYRPGPNLPGPGKMYVNATTLPDRTVLVSNGGRYNRDDASNVLTASIYDPATNAWRSVAADPIGRNYHSTAVLMPDGKVAVLGSNPGDGSYELRISIYEPPYLFKGARPTITGAPTEATYGQAITFGTGAADGRTVQQAQLVRPMSVTHQMDSNMRLVDLPMTVEGGMATATLPANRNLLPPGPYMLTVTDSAGVPSTAEWVMVK